MLFKKAIETLKPYVAGRPISEVKRELGLKEVTKLASNENPYGCSEKAKEAIIKAAGESNIYPDGSAYDLRQALSLKLCISPDELVFGTGSDGLLELIGKAFLSEGDEAVMPTPSFSLYETNTLSEGAKAVKIPLTKEYKMDLEKMYDAITDKTRVIWLCNPNNPTGEISTGDEIDAFINKVPKDILIVLDEAYYEFAKGRGGYGEHIKGRSENVIILRTFSKIYGLAGLRCGYGIADKNVIKEIEKVRSPFNVSIVAQYAATASLTDDDFVNFTLAENEKNLKYLCDEFTKMGLYYIPSYTNFVAVKTPVKSVDAYNALMKKGYIVKGGHTLALEEGFLRVTVGTKNECEGFIKALLEVIAENEKS